MDNLKEIENHIELLKGESFIGWSESEINGYLTSLESVNDKLKSIMKMKRDLNKSKNIFKTYEECEREAIDFTDKQMSIAGGLLSDDYKTGYREGITHYLSYKNKL